MKIINAPSYLTKYLVACEMETKKEIQAEYGEYTNVFKINLDVKKIELTWNKMYDCEEGSIYAIDENGQQVLLFSADLHGYNGQFELYELETNVEVRELSLKECETGNEIVLAFQYSGDEEEYVSEGKSDKIEDYFGWIVIYQKCDTKLIKIFEFECA